MLLYDIQQNIRRISTAATLLTLGVKQNKFDSPLCPLSDTCCGLWKRSLRQLLRSVVKMLGFNSDYNFKHNAANRSTKRCW